MSSREQAGREGRREKDWPRCTDIFQQAVCSNECLRLSEWHIMIIEQKDGFIPDLSLNVSLTHLNRTLNSFLQQFTVHRIKNKFFFSMLYLGTNAQLRKGFPVEISQSH